MQLGSGGDALVRTNIALVGAMNAGKSTLMNLLTQQCTSIVDSTPGTTADTKTSVMEMHELGPVKLMDTPGIDERGELGAKKRQKAEQTLRESDVAVLVIDPSSTKSIDTSFEVLQRTVSAGMKCRPVVLYNVRSSAAGGEEKGQERKAVIDTAIAEIDARMAKVLGTADQSKDNGDPTVPSLAVDFHAPQALARVISFLCTASHRHQAPVSLLPPGVRLDRNSRVLLNILMDGESPSGRLLRPQAMLQEALLRDYVGVFAHRMDLQRARSSRSDEVEAERERFLATVRSLRSDDDGLRMIVTDSQAIKEVASWTGDVPVPLTTFSVMMANYMSGGRLPLFIEGLRRFEQLERHSRVLICEACNHDRIQDDIGTVQIPAALRKRFGEDGITVEHSFGRQYQTAQFKDYSLILHCGGCMLDQQQMNARLADLQSTGVPITNYGLLLSYLASPQALKRVLEPWSLTFT